MAKRLDHLLAQLPAKRRAAIEARAGELATLTDSRQAVEQTRQDISALELARTAFRSAGSGSNSRRRRDGDIEAFADTAAIRANDFKLSAGRYRPMDQTAVEHRDPRKLLDELAAIEAEIVEEVEALRVALSN